MNEQIIELGNKIKTNELTWEEAAKTFNKQFNLNLSSEALRKRYQRLVGVQKMHKEEEIHNQDGSIEIEKRIWFDEDEIKSPETILKKFGYNPNEWELISWTFGKWEVALKDEKLNRICTTIRAKIKPKVSEANLQEVIEVAKELIQKEIKPLDIKRQIKKGLDENKLMEIPSIELHLGKMAWGGDTGQDYDKNIAQNRFYEIMCSILEIQEQEQCGNALITIGNDFFNSDTVNATTTKGTPQTNDLRWKKMFLIGLKLYTEFIETLRTKFNNIDIRLCSGNHDKMSSFYLYITLQQYFRNDTSITFSNDYKDYQCYQFGKCAIFFGHGDGNLKRIMHSIPAEFYKEWGSSYFRELHLGHLHKEVVVDDESGMITRRIGSPTGTDQWHYEERFIGATQKHQIFIWDKTKGLKSIEYINFDNSKKKLTKGGRK